MGAAIRIIKNPDMDPDTLRNTRANRISFREDIPYDSTVDDDQLPLCLLSIENREISMRRRRVTAVRFEDMDDHQRRTHSLQSQSCILQRQQSRTDFSNDSALIWRHGQQPHESLHGRSCSLIECSHTQSRSKIQGLKPLPRRVQAPIVDRAYHYSSKASD